jgi:hypothetical protein
VLLTPKAGGIALEFQPSEGLELMNVFFKDLPAK